MPRRTRPRRGSLQYWPRKRARRIYSRTSHWPNVSETKPLGFAGWKAGMTHVQIIDTNTNSPTYGKFIARPVTIIDAPSLFVCALRFYKKSPSLHVVSEEWCDKIPKDLELKRKTNIGKQTKKDNKDFDDVRLIVSTQPAKSGMKKKKPEIFEIAVGGDKEKKYEYAKSILGKEIKIEDVFRPGEFVDVSAVTKGHGYTGTVKRFGIRIQTRKDKQMHRHPGSIGSTVPRKVDWRVPMPGQYGFFNRTEYNKRIIMIDNDPKKITPKGGFIGYGLIKGSYILIEGSVPGPRKRLIRLRKSVRTQKVVPVDVKYISTESKQGV
ncbi:MAG: 50S ribosomal protein L3 [Candidatus Aenigmatarchaeota archaeon]